MFDQQSPTRFEQLIKQSALPRTHASVLAGAARATRLSYTRRTPQENVVLATASGLVATLAVLFVWWALQRARQQKVRRIYFLSRDGEIFLKVAQALCSAWGLDTELRYLYCSREALLVPSFHQVGAFETNWITWAYQGTIDVREICARLDLEVDDIAPFLASVGLAQYADHPDQPIPAKLSDRLRRALHDDKLWEVARERVRPRFELTRDYLLQEGFADGEKYALLDTGWTGSSQYALGEILRKANIPATVMTGYYLGVNREAWFRPDDLLEGFLFDWRQSWRDERLYNFICFELLFSGLHGRTIGYRYEAGRFGPVFGSGLQGFALDISKVHHQIAAEVARRVATLLRFDEFSPDSAARLGRRLMMEFICKPSSDIAETYGDWPMASEIREADIQQVAPPMSFAQFLRNAFGHEKVKGYWPQASLRRGGLHTILETYNLFVGAGLLEWYRRLVLRY